MAECICDLCKNLKSEPDKEEGSLLLSCEYGFPSDDCDDCEGDGCEATCENFEAVETPELSTAKCCVCGKELTTSSDNEDETVYCLDCYLKRD
ncbi:MAG: hypothetical protein H7Y41_02800 [Hyphomonadaceae bacterium]|nr:hypothetical protein [Clostridia bacterium]